MEQERQEQSSGFNLTKAKDASLVTKIIAAIWTIVASVLKAMGLFKIEVWEIGVVAGVLVSLYSDVAINLFLEKLGKK